MTRPIRALFHNVKGTGHVNPTLPLVRGLLARGHEVVYTNAPEWRDRLEALGCRFRNTAGPDDAPFTTADYNPGRPFYRQLLPATAAMLPRLVAETREIEPDVIVFDSCAPWGFAIAKVLGCAGVCSVSTLVFDREEVRREHGDPAERIEALGHAALAELRVRWDVDLSDRDIGLFYGDENLVYSCESLNPTIAAVRGRFHLVGTTFAAATEDLTAEGLGPFVEGDGRRRLYLSMGTAAGGTDGLPPGFFASFIEAFGGRADTKLLLSIGTKVSRAALGSLPANVTVRASVPQIAILGHVDAFITHAGANSMHEGLFHGVPLVCVPLMGDQPQNARRVVANGAGVLLPREELSPRRILDEVERVLVDCSFAANAARIGQELQSAGGLARAVEVIEHAAASTARE